ncbi:MAG: hypothetical protein ACR2GK_00540 [Gemmatimonadaceae bacterium]
MKLSMLIVAAGVFALPAMASAQNMPRTTQVQVTRDSTLQPRPVPPSDGTTCPWGCPTSSGAAGLSGAQFLALQQELRDAKCGTRHVTGRLDAATRTAIRTCARRMGVANNARAVLLAMNIGYGETDIPMAGMGRGGRE